MNDNQRDAALVKWAAIAFLGYLLFTALVAIFGSNS